MPITNHQHFVPSRQMSPIPSPTVLASPRLTQASTLPPLASLPATRSAPTESYPVNASSQKPTGIPSSTQQTSPQIAHQASSQLSSAVGFNACCAASPRPFGYRLQFLWISVLLRTNPCTGGHDALATGSGGGYGSGASGNQLSDEADVTGGVGFEVWVTLGDDTEEDDEAAGPHLRYPRGHLHSQFIRRIIEVSTGFTAYNDYHPLFYPPAWYRTDPVPPSRRPTFTPQPVSTQLAPNALRTSQSKRPPLILPPLTGQSTRSKPPISSWPTGTLIAKVASAPRHAQAQPGPLHPRHQDWVCLRTKWWASMVVLPPSTDPPAPGCGDTRSTSSSIIATTLIIVTLD
ncbi:hypothetical protein BJ508DRAFT_332813 [Ascobolus immersus RN42]|uniref:Uncharacterized protein n=1 Tax=Ascobolus immersus RN42 TaxID=1160509 RepID=A0A3N4HN28_ASCIM|nr:hypothetical protein BJ508DRAFT_332813 [Ascobolus immersus RN42]